MLLHLVAHLQSVVLWWYMSRGNSSPLQSGWVFTRVIGVIKAFVFR